MMAVLGLRFLFIYFLLSEETNRESKSGFGKKAILEESGFLLLSLITSFQRFFRAPIPVYTYTGMEIVKTVRKRYLRARRMQ